MQEPKKILNSLKKTSYYCAVALLTVAGMEHTGYMSSTVLEQPIHYTILLWMGLTICFTTLTYISKSRKE